MRWLAAAVLKRLLPRTAYLSLYDRYNWCVRRLHALTCIGAGRQCPLCGRQCRRFLAGGVDAPVYRDKQVRCGGRRPEVVCPWCECSDKERHLYLYLSCKTGIFSETVSLLHVGPERMLQSILRQHPNICYLSADLDSPLAMVRMDITDIQCPDSSFDVILCCHVLEHVSDDRRAMRELYRVLKPGGWAILQAPVSRILEETDEDPAIVDPAERLRRFGQADHVRLYGRDYTERLEQAGFVVERYSFQAEFGEPAARRHGLMPDEELFICRRPAPPASCASPLPS
jgi:SAM-dependent methyltransferase